MTSSKLHTVERDECCCCLILRVCVTGAGGGESNGHKIRRRTWFLPWFYDEGKGLVQGYRGILRRWYDVIILICYANRIFAVGRNGGSCLRYGSCLCWSSLEAVAFTCVWWESVSLLHGISPMRLRKMWSGEIGVEKMLLVQLRDIATLPLRILLSTIHFHALIRGAASHSYLNILRLDTKCMWKDQPPYWRLFDFCRNECTCTPVHYFVILSMQRSGSGWFETLLNNHPNISSHGEIFSVRERRDNFSSIAMHLDMVYNLDWFNSASKNECTAAVGFKWMLNQVALEFLFCDKRTSIIV